MNDKFYCYGTYDEMHPKCLRDCPDRKSCIIETALKELEKEGECKDVAIYSEKNCGKGETPLLMRSPFFNKSEVEYG